MSKVSLCTAFTANCATQDTVSTTGAMQLFSGMQLNVLRRIRFALKALCSSVVMLIGYMKIT